MTDSRDEQLIKAALPIWHQHFTWEPRAIGVHCGIVWMTADSPSTGVNGYAMIPAEGHPWSKELPDNIDGLIDAHGGLTYHSHPFIGFDTAHAWDYWPPKFDGTGIWQRIGRMQGSIEWTPEMVIKEARILAHQLAVIGDAAKPVQHIDINDFMRELRNNG